MHFGNPLKQKHRTIILTIFCITCIVNAIVYDDKAIFAGIDIKVSSTFVFFGTMIIFS